MNKFINILAGFLLGAAIGAGVVLLLAPRSGQDTRQMVKDRMQAVVDEGKKAAETRRLELLAEFEARKEAPAAA